MCYIECIWREANERSITFSTSECVAPIPPSPPFPIIVYIQYICTVFYTLFISCTNSKVQLHLWMYFFVVLNTFFFVLHTSSPLLTVVGVHRNVYLCKLCVLVCSLSHTHSYYCIINTHTHTHVLMDSIVMSLVLYIYINIFFIAIFATFLKIHFFFRCSSIFSPNFNTYKDILFTHTHILQQH